ncbi:MAG: AI-2E family transporter [Candidatus Solibacter usitatus]|nr:AI-2E family transporter [Candidatus Solibacter usitatus]
MAVQSGNRLALAVLLALAAGSAGLVYVLLRPFLEPIFFAIVLAIAFQPAFQRISSRIQRPALASLAATLLLLALVLAPLGMLGMTIVNEARSFYAQLAQQSAQEGGWGTWLGNVADKPVQWVASRTGVPAPDVKSMAAGRAKSWSEGLVRWGGSLLGNLTSTIGDGMLCLFVLFFLFLEGDAIRRGIVRWLPLPHGRTEELMGSITQSVVANIYGIAAVGSAQGVLTGLGFLFTGLPAPVMWGTLAAFASLVPLVGPALIWAPGVLVLLFNGAWGKALFLALWGVLAVGMTDNLLRPWILSGKTEMNTLVVFFALMGGMQAFGFIGLFAGPVIFSVAMSVFRILREEYLDEPAADSLPAAEA